MIRKILIQLATMITKRKLNEDEQNSSDCEECQKAEGEWDEMKLCEECEAEYLAFARNYSYITVVHPLLNVETKASKQGEEQ